VTPAHVAVVMGSASDLPVMSPAADVLAEFGIASELRVVSAHRTPDHLLRYGHEAKERGLRVLIAGAGGAAHLPGMLAAVTSLPVIGVPVALDRLDGLDSLLSIVQMPRGVPVATVAINGAANAALLALRILAVDDAPLAAALDRHREVLADEAHRQDQGLGSPG
jgi:5-(carboxyamino)imidazole ribonucleotide mutase